jgi:hypothetical protein
MSDRDANCFWAVWCKGQEWPGLFASESAAKDRVHILAKSNVGAEVHLMKISSIGTVKYPNDPVATGDMAS